MKNKHAILAFLVGLSVITFLDRICIASAGARIQDDLGIPPERWGWVLGAFVLSYGLFEIPTGAMGDRQGHRRVLTRIVVWWSAFTSLTGAVTGFWQLVITRFLFGAGEAGAYPNMAGVVSRWFGPAERARAQGFIWAASRLGGALAPLIVVPLQARFGWRVVFFLFGLVGMVWSAAWWLSYRDPAAAARPKHALIPMTRPVWIIVAMYFCYAFGSWFYFTWFPVYLVKGAGFTEAQMGVFSALPFLMGALGNVAGGWLSDRLVARYGLKTGRRVVGVVSLTLASLLMLGMTLTRQPAAIVVMSSLGFGVADLMLPSAWAICLDIGKSHAGVLTGIMNTAGQAGGFVCSVLFGYVVQATGSYRAPVWIVAAMVMTAAAFFSRIDATRPLEELRPAHLPALEH